MTENDTNIEESGKRTRMQIQHAEIDQTIRDLKRQRMFLERFIGMRGSEAPAPAKSYIRGVHDGLCWAGREVQGITKIEDYQHVFDPRFIPDDRLSNMLETLVTEGSNGNYGNVRVNAERVVEYCLAVEEEQEAAGEEQADGGDSDDG